MKRARHVKIVATLGPASEGYDMIRKLYEAGADVFRLNMSHGGHDEIRARHAAIRQVEKDIGRPIAILADLQGPKLRCGSFANGEGYDLETARSSASISTRRRATRGACSCPTRRSSRRSNPGRGFWSMTARCVCAWRMRFRFRRLHGRGWRSDFQPQGRERARRGAAAGGAV
jgi:hypothetical protein